MQVGNQRFKMMCGLEVALVGSYLFCWHREPGLNGHVEWPSKEKQVGNK